MATDYRHRSRKRRKRKPIPGWIWMVTGLLLGLFIAFLGYLQSQKVETPFTTSQAEPGTKPTIKPAPKKPRFDFYTILPEMEVIIPDEEVEAHVRKITPKTTMKPTSTDTYFLQVGSFKNNKDADALRAKLALSGHTTQIQTVKINQDTWHRVRVGPFRSYASLRESRLALEAAGMHAVPLKTK